ncbi:MAG: glycogen/starch/alpha-glucan phosphorylase [Ignavibacteria bacterium]|nr:Maltodextrin phosphorylase [Ignavibacteria bacterium]MCC6886714.1 glycogen/starch/alpha-glucan phosphorylase [Ignavibacteriales bacterium]
MSIKQNENIGTSIFFTDEPGVDKYNLPERFAEYLEYNLVKDKTSIREQDAYKALSLSIRDRLIRNWLRTQYNYTQNAVKKVYYLSLEFLMGRLLGNALVNLDFYNECYSIMKKLGYVLEDVREFENDMGLGNGGLGRLAACFIDSLSTLEFPAYGYGIRYEYGIFKQEIDNGYQHELPDNWIQYGNPWEIIRPEVCYKVRFKGKVISKRKPNGSWKFKWVDTEEILAVAFDVPVPGYKNNTVNNLRLWKASATNDFNFESFNQGDYLSAVEQKNNSEIISKVLYPNDSFYAGKVLRLKQQYFFVSATIQDIIRNYKTLHKNFKEFSEKTSIQLNETHPAIGIPELMRILMDEEGIGWDEAWEITRNTFSYTNHTIVPEALEEWPVEMFEELFPRHLQIIYEINHRFLQSVIEHPGSDENIEALSIIRETDVRSIRMSNLAIIGSHKVNGVAKLHSDILKHSIFKHFYDIFPEKFINITNGITQRRWLLSANPLLAGIISDKIGTGWITNLAELKEIEKYIEDESFRDNWKNVKWINKKNLIAYIESLHNIKINPNSLFDVQIKRFHEYKRQLLNILNVISMYIGIKDNPDRKFTPRTVIFGGKAAPSYTMAKLIIKLINSVSEVINSDPVIGNKLKVIFIKNYSVSLAEKIIPASELSVQISTAGYEASGTGNMKFALNGALTVGTLDGANIEMAEEIGREHMFIFGKTADEVASMKSDGYAPYEYYLNDELIKRVIDLIKFDYFNRNEPGIFKPIADELLYNDKYLVLADFRAFNEIQREISEAYNDQEMWTVKSILNVSRIGKFSSDRSIKEYAAKVWNIKPISKS